MNIKLKAKHFQQPSHYTSHNDCPCARAIKEATGESYVAMGLLSAAIGCSFDKQEYKVHDNTDGERGYSWLKYLADLRKANTIGFDETVIREITLTPVE